MLAVELDVIILRLNWGGSKMLKGVQPELWIMLAVEFVALTIFSGQNFLILLRSALIGL